MHYVYCLINEARSERRYVGYTTRLGDRIRAHNAGRNPSTSSLDPWRLLGYIAFGSKLQALAFERYIKSGSGHAFRKKRLGW